MAYNDFPCTVGGTAPRQYPLCTLTINSFTGSTYNTVTISNPVTNSGISVYRAWNAGDVLVVDFLNKTVTVNGTAVDFAGVFAYWSPGSNNIRVTDDFTVRNVNLTATLVNRYI